ncbi:hypothetical protein ACFL0S_11375 [Thermodesulfobacteriota bacterium]
MKKVIAAAAGLMLVGTMVGSASADVSFGGDARARAYYQQDYDFGSTTVDEETGAVTRDREQDNFIASRVRIQARATAPGGAYAVGRALYGNGTWDGGNSGTADIDADKAYIGVPMGMTLLQAGRLPVDLLRSTAFFEQDVTKDGLQFDVMATDMATIGLWYFINYEARQNGDNVDDNDISDYGIYADLKFGGDWGTRMGILYRDDQVLNDDRDDDGAFGGIEFAGPGGPLAISGAIAFDDRGEGDTGWGAFASAGMQFGATGVALEAGFTDKGFVTDGDYGFIMIGGGASITPYTIGSEGESNWWIGVPVSFAVSEMLTLKGNLAYIDMDEFGEGFEISGSLVYLISDGANVQWDIGYLGYSQGDGGIDGDFALDDEGSPFGTALTFNVSF